MDRGFFYTVHSPTLNSINNNTSGVNKRLQLNLSMCTSRPAASLYGLWVECRAFGAGASVTCLTFLHLL